MMNSDLFQFAYIPVWLDQLDSLAQMALPEPWRYRNIDPLRKNNKTPVLDRYIRTVFRNQAIEHQSASSQNAADEAIMIRDAFVVFNTGLVTKYMKPIYAFFERNKREGLTHTWYFKGFMDDSSPPLKYISPLPGKPFSNVPYEMISFLPHWPLRVNVEHILNDPENWARIPEQFRTFKNLYLLLETGAEMTRRMAEIMPSIVVAQIYQGRIQYLMPMCLSDPNSPDLAMTVTPMEGYHLCSTCLTLEMAYNNARLLAKPTAPWLTSLVE